ncbi:MAG: hypothetical protein NZ898_07305 [Myxococcota bacterium]|nr:hypothetical protein [Myxococcota bacterium]MDW8362145.1 hypothetical protein [Myxococcales bacterium]
MSLRARWLLFALAACGASEPRLAATVPLSLPERVDERTVARAERALHALPLDHPSRPALLDAILGVLEERARRLLEEEGSHERRVALLEHLASLLQPEDYARGRLPAFADRIAERLVVDGSPRGEEAVVLGALCIRRAMHPQDGALIEHYEMVAEWSWQARERIRSPVERFGRLLRIWEAQARLCPAPHVLERWVRLYVERHDAIVQEMTAGPNRNLRREELLHGPLLVRATPLDVAGVHLRFGDLAGARRSLAALGRPAGAGLSSGTDAGVQRLLEALGRGGGVPLEAGRIAGLDLRLVRLLDEASSGDNDALLQLADAYRSGRAEVTRGLCRLGLRRAPTDPRFPLCLARVERAAGRWGEVAAWIERVAALGTDERAVLDESLELLRSALDADEAGADAELARDLLRVARTVLDAHESRWPGHPPPLSRERLEHVAGVLALQTGEASAARRHLDASISLRPTPAALVQRGRLAELQGDAATAVRMYRDALDRLEDDAGPVQRAALLEHLGDAFRVAGNPEQSARMYREALTLLEQVPRSRGVDPADVLVSRAILEARLGRAQQATRLFRESFAGWRRRETAARALAFLATAPVPDAALAEEALAAALRVTALTAEWKVYFALWTLLVGARAGVAPSPLAIHTLEEQSDGARWHERLARLVRGKIRYEDLLAEARTRGERAEAFFYEGVRRLADGDREGAERQFRLVLETEMLGFYEYAMAAELVGR